MTIKIPKGKKLSRAGEVWCSCMNLQGALKRGVMPEGLWVDRDRKISVVTSVLARVMDHVGEELRWRG